MTIEPVEHIFDRLADEARFNFNSVVEEPSESRRAAEEGLSKELS